MSGIEPHGAGRNAPGKGRAGASHHMPELSGAEGVRATRELFWNNVVREILTSLSALEAEHRGEQGGDQVFDGRLAVITTLGQRIPIRSVYPLFACGVSGSPVERALSMEVECTVFQIETPSGEVFTLPLHEIRAVHAVSAELMEQIKQAAGDVAEADEGQMPFGFAAFTALAKSQRVPEMPSTTVVGPGLPL